MWCDAIPLGRDDQIKTIKLSIKSLCRNKPMHLFIHGSNGSGKTLSIKHALESENQNYVYVNCGRYRTELAILSKLCINLGVIVPIKGIACCYVTERLEEALKKNGKLVIVLDDLDCSTDMSKILLDLFLILEENPKIKISIITVFKDLESLKHLNREVISRFFSKTIYFPKYDKQELETIIKKFCTEIDFRLDSKHIDTISSIIANKTGDCRTAISCVEMISQEQSVQSNEIICVLRQNQVF
jgi:Cdc6-like AAA superfamily ATPase